MNQWRTFGAALRTIGLAALLTAHTAIAASAEPERITSFHSDIQVLADASMVVEETIEVQAQGYKIRRGIFRDFPTRYKDRTGNQYRVQFEVLSVKRDGNAEEYRVASLSNGVRVYVGKESVSLKPGRYTYRIRYSTTRQLGYFADYDQLYWNVTGNGWDFSITKASASVHLPGDIAAAQIETSGFTGKFGGKGTNYIATTTHGRADFETTAPLPRTQGLTLVVNWPKGHVFEPSAVDRLGYLLTDNLGLLLTLLALAGSGLYLLIVWYRLGKDPEPGIVFAHYAAPEGHSPASARYLSKMDYDTKTFSAAVVSLAVKGHVKIVQKGDAFTLKKLESTQEIAPGEKALLASLFGRGASIDLEERNHVAVRSAQAAHEAVLAKRYKRIYFKTNASWVFVSGLASAVAVVLVLALDLVTPWVVVAFAANVVLHLLFLYLMKAPTARGRALLDKLDGFELYLSVAEHDDLNLAHSPEKTPELFERFLPFAMALGVETEWAEKFSAVFASINGAAGYHPDWYIGRFSDIDVVNFSSGVSESLSSAISSSSTPPGSSSGSGGGGFSGGGGGGGGGGGW